MMYNHKLKLYLILSRFILFFSGLLSGLALLHIFLIFKISNVANFIGLYRTMFQ